MNLKIVIALAVALTLGLFALSSSNPAAPQQGQKLRADSGVIDLGPNQIMRITVAARLDTAKVRFRRLGYAEGTPIGGVSKQTVSSDTQSALITLAPGESASMDVPSPSDTLRTLVTSDRADVQVRIMIVDTETGKIESYIGSGDDGQSI